jgi:matrix metalloproteinase-14 (membrane-inserted)
MFVKEILDKVNNINISEEDIGNLLKYLRAYRYIKDNGFGFEDVLKAVENLNKSFGVDGGLTQQTVKITQYSRCGCPDFIEEVSENSKWAYKHIKYYIDAFVPGLTKDEQRAITKQCGQDASNVCGLTFEEVFKASQADIVLTTGRGNGLGTPGNVLAYAYLPSGPNHTGQLEAVFDLADIWIKDATKRGIVYRNVCNHEVFCGHSVGLTHSQVPSALMAPFYSPNVAIPQQNDDIIRLQNRYPKAPGRPPVNPPQPDPNIPTQGDELIIKITGSISNIDIPGFRIYKT